MNNKILKTIALITALTLTLTIPITSYAAQKTSSKQKESLNKKEKINWKKKQKKYPTATKIWKNLKKQGYSDYVCAGILGNIMAETGGNTLNIHPKLKSSNYYGICQWSKKYYPKVNGKDLSYQLKFLNKTIKNELNTYGFKYKSKFNYKKFKKLKDEKQAALAFAKSYERCASYTYNVRKKNATKAYKYFTN